MELQQMLFNAFEGQWNQVQSKVLHSVRESVFLYFDSMYLHGLSLSYLQDICVEVKAKFHRRPEVNSLQHVLQ